MCDAQRHTQRASLRDEGVLGRDRTRMSVRLSVVRVVVFFAALYSLRVGFRY